MKPITLPATVYSPQKTQKIQNGIFYTLAGVGGRFYTEATLKFLKLNTQAQQREAIVQGRSLSPYRLRYIFERYDLLFA
ncbi:MAG: hypothetical protein LBJ00_16265 [Planctomycetaceae bacterium]|nr:hypothetical protein [Planctomycetaceae bacterium]